MNKGDGSGFGRQVPPCRDHVLIWFLENGRTEQVAHAFLQIYEAKGWRNKKGSLISNWKGHAWRWVWH